MFAGSLVLTTVWLVLAPAAASLSNVIHIVLEKGRYYNPGDLFLHKGDTIILVNDDENAVHHAFIEAEQFPFDAGDQEPGGQTAFIVREPGDFVIWCGVHPKMKLTLHVL